MSGETRGQKGQQVEHVGVQEFIVEPLGGCMILFSDLGEFS